MKGAPNLINLLFAVNIVLGSSLIYIVYIMKLESRHTQVCFGSINSLKSGTWCNILTTFDFSRIDFSYRRALISQQTFVFQRFRIQSILRSLL